MSREECHACKETTNSWFFPLFNAFIHALPVNLKEKNRKAADSFDNFVVEFVSNSSLKILAETTTAHGGVIGPS